MAGLVVDASVSAAWCFEDEASDFTESVLDEVARHGARVPALWPFEMSNVLAISERRGRIDGERVSQFTEALLALPVQVEPAEARLLLPALTRVARAQRLTAYDASYLDLAYRMGLPLATRDEALRTAALQIGVALFEI